MQTAERADAPSFHVTRHPACVQIEIYDDWGNTSTTYRNGAEPLAEKRIAALRAAGYVELTD